MNSDGKPIDKEKFNFVRRLLAENANPLNKHKLLLYEIAELAGCHRHTVRRIEKGWPGPSLKGETMRFNNKSYKRCDKCRNMVETSHRCRICESKQDRERNESSWKPSLGPAPQTHEAKARELQERVRQFGLKQVCSICGFGPVLERGSHFWCTVCHNPCEYCPSPAVVAERCAKLRNNPT